MWEVVSDRSKMSDTEDVVGVICVDAKGQVLLVQGKGGKWSFPKGRRKSNETHYQGAIREAREEAGIDLTGRPVNVKINLRYGTYYLYAFGRTGDQISLESSSTPEEIETVAWVNLKSTEFLSAEKNADLRFYCKKN
jgi:8-oxo-dGTP pyrophosphatase MutT (NUDIX family)